MMLDSLSMAALQGENWLIDSPFLQSNSLYKYVGELDDLFTSLKSKACCWGSCSHSISTLISCVLFLLLISTRLMKCMNQVGTLDAYQFAELCQEIECVYAWQCVEVSLRQMKQFNSLPKFVQGHGNPEQNLVSGATPKDAQGEIRQLHEGSWEFQHIYIQSFVQPQLCWMLVEFARELPTTDYNY